MFIPTTIFHQTLSVPETLLGVGRLLPYQLGWGRCDVAIIWAKILQAIKKIPMFLFNKSQKNRTSIYRSQHLINTSFLPSFTNLTQKNLSYPPMFFSAKKIIMSRQRYCFKALEFMRKVSTKFSCQPSRAPDLGFSLEIFLFSALGFWRMKPISITLRGTNISHLGKRKIIFKMPFLGDMLGTWRIIPGLVSG